jgi:hypothetical protein
MKISVDVDCTPEEARRFMGLPDLTPVHDAYLSRIRAALEQGVTPDMVKQMVQGWAPMGDAGLALWQQMIEQLGGRKGS